MIDWAAYVGGTYNDDNYEAMVRRVGDHGNKLGAFGAIRCFGPDTAFNLLMEKYRA